MVIGNESPRLVRLGLYGDAAPASVATFRGLCTASLPGAPGLTYRGSTVSRVERDRYVLLGKLSGGEGRTFDREIDSTGFVRTTFVERADSYRNSDDNRLSHGDRAGLLSVKRGGGSFEFMLTLRPDAALDRERLVIGEVLPDDDGVDGGGGGGASTALAAIGAVPTRAPSGELSGLASLLCPLNEATLSMCVRYS